MGVIEQNTINYDRIPAISTVMHCLKELKKTPQILMALQPGYLSHISTIKTYVDQTKDYKLAVSWLPMGVPRAEWLAG